MDREFLITNSIGGYCSSDFKLGNTRKYHGLLVAAHHDLTRVNIVNRIEDWLTIDDKKYPLSTNIYKGNVLAPDGSKNLLSFDMVKYPSWTFSIGDVTLVKSVVLKKGINKLVVRYDISNNGSDDIKLGLFPLLANRDKDTVQKVVEKDLFKKYIHPDHILVNLDETHLLKVDYKGFSYTDTPDVYFDFFYPIEESRGYPAHEDLQKLGDFSATVPPGNTKLEVSFEYFRTKPSSPDESDVFEEYNSYTDNLYSEFYSEHNLARSNFVDGLLESADSFVVNSLENTAILAGYHWFGEWGRDTFMSFNGLLIIPSRFEEAKAILLKWNKYFKDGLLPNLPFFGDYNSLDGVLWFAVALWSYYHKTKDIETVKMILPNLEDSLVSFTTGTKNIKEENGYLVNNNHDKALTWMDAQVDGVPVTPRSGKAVEIQALWFNFLKILQFFKEELDDQTYLTQIRALATKLKRNFSRDFWNIETNCLFDFINEDYKDPAIRPNQIIVLYLPFELVGKRNAKAILETVIDKLLTPVGLRTLSEDNQMYQGEYKGEQIIRDKAYHQGTVWPFWTGLFLSSYLKQNNYSKKSVEFAKAELDKFINTIKEYNLRYIPEIFEASTLRPDGCLSQAWSVAFTLELISDIALNT